jgi:Protein of unknown function (DUF1569)
MDSLQDPAVIADFTKRIEKLTPNSQRQWGKMDVAQMLAHCATAMETNMGERKSKQSFMGKLFGKMAKKSVVNAKPFKQGLPTDPGFVVKGEKDFHAEKLRVISVLKRVSVSDPEQLAKTPHPFFGMMNAEEWNTLNYKHLDHHLRQFGA